jgi:hypothetical protein
MGVTLLLLSPPKRIMGGWKSVSLPSHLTRRERQAQITVRPVRVCFCVISNKSLNYLKFIKKLCELNNRNKKIQEKKA